MNLLWAKVIVFAHLLGASALAEGEGVVSRANSELESGIFKAEVASENSRKKLATGYLRHLQAVKGRYQSVGDLKSLLPVAEEIERFEKGRAVALDDTVEKPTDLANAQRDYMRAIGKLDRQLDDSLTNLYAGHVKVLDSLVESLTRSGDIEQAKSAAAAVLAAREKHAALVKRTAEFQNVDAKIEEMASRVPPPEDATEWNGHHYKRFKSNKVTFQTAKRACEKMGGHLVYLGSQDERKFVNRIAKGNTRWVGATDSGTEGEWQWLDGTAVEESFHLAIKVEDSRTHDYLYLTDSGEIGCRKADGNFPGKTFRWVNGYVCEWDY